MLLARDNPFAVHRVMRVRYRLDETGWTELLARLDVLDRRAALVGPCGSGKTTLLEDLAPRLEMKGWRVHWVQLSTEEARVPAGFWQRRWTENDFVFLDGAEQLGVMSWGRFRWAVRNAGGLLITTHQGGRLPTLRRCETTPQLLRELTAELNVELSEAESAQLFQRHSGNLREAMRELYDRAGQTTGRDVSPRRPSAERTETAFDSMAQTRVASRRR